MTWFHSQPCHVDGAFSACMVKQAAKFNQKLTDQWSKHARIKKWQ